MRNIIVLLFVLTGFSIMPFAVAGTSDTVLWGEQTAGTGPGNNAKTDGNTLVLTATATIISVDGDQDDFCIWSIVTPKNRQARSVLCGGKGREDVVGKTLPAGSYRVIPGVSKKNKARITIKFK